MLNVTLDTKQAVEKLRRARRGHIDARTEALKLIAGPAMAAMIARVPRDTHRLANSYIDAAVGAGLGAFVPDKEPIVPSKYEAQQREALERQLAAKIRNVEFWRKRVAILERTVVKAGKGGGGSGLMGRGGELVEARRELNKAQQDVIKAQREAGKFQEGRGDIVFGIFGSGRAGRRIGTTVAVKVYGGEGHLIESPSATVMQFKSKEPHAAIIESRDHGVRNLKAAVKRAVGLTSMKRKYVEELRTKFGRT